MRRMMRKNDEIDVPMAMWSIWIPDCFGPGDDDGRGLIKTLVKK